jgi:cell division transport system ATP-binding protein
MITFDQVSKRFGERLALDSGTWHMAEGECVVILGHSGAGKTTLLRLITHEIQPTSGTVTVGTFQGGRLKRHQRALLRRTLGIIYEDFRLLGDRTVFENVALAVRIAGRFRDDEVIPRVMYALEEVGLQSMQAAFPHELSAGEKQRAAIARAIVNRPAVILADEPTGALEPRSSEDVLALLRRIHGEGAAVLLVTTRRDVAAALPGRLILLEDGRLSGDGVGAVPHSGAPAPPAPEAAARAAADAGTEA